MYKKTKRRIFEILDMASKGDKLSRAWDIFIVTLITLNVAAVIFETVPSIDTRLGAFFNTFEIVSVIIFTIEYIFRLWSANSDEKYKGRIWGRLKYATSFLAIIDLIAILPFYLPMFLPFDFRIIRILRLVRIFRVFKIGRYSKSVAIIGRVFYERKEQLVIAAGAVLFLLIIASSLMYYVENPAQPESFSSIPASMWWGVATLTTVGYGDVYPITPLGKILGAIIAILGVGLFALPAGILAGGFAEQIEKKRENYVCPKCGHRF